MHCTKPTFVRKTWNISTIKVQHIVDQLLQTATAGWPKEKKFCLGQPYRALTPKAPKSPVVAQDAHNAPPAVAAHQKRETKVADKAGLPNSRQSIYTSVLSFTMDRTLGSLLCVASAYLRWKRRAHCRWSIWVHNVLRNRPLNGEFLFDWIKASSSIKVFWLSL